jgi:hypothetical protein
LLFVLENVLQFNGNVKSEEFFTLYRFESCVIERRCLLPRFNDIGSKYMKEYGALIGWYCEGQTEVLGEKPIPVPQCPLYIPQEMAGDRTRS